MSKFIKLIPLLLVLAFTACEKDDPDSGSTLEGTYKLTALTVTDGSTTSSGPGFPTTTSSFTSFGKDFAAEVVFDANGTFTSSGTYTQVMEIEIPIIGGTQNIEFVHEDFLQSGTWDIVGSTMTTQNAGQDPQDADIIQNDGTTLELNAVLTVSNTEQGISYISTGNYNMIMEK